MNLKQAYLRKYKPRRFVLATPAQLSSVPPAPTDKPGYMVIREMTEKRLSI